jgi:hypothetical protein
MSLKLLASFAKKQERRRKMRVRAIILQAVAPSACRQLKEEISHFAGRPVQPA